MAKMFTDLTPEGRRYFAELQKLEELEIHVGFNGNEGGYENGATVAEVAAYNEFGSSSKPARPFMKQSFENHESELQSGCDEVNAALSQGKTAEAALDRLGLLCKGLVQEEIVNGGFAPNAPATIRAKGSAQPLIDSSHMRQSVNYVIKKRGE